MISIRRARRQRLVTGVALGSTVVAVGFGALWLLVLGMLQTREIRELSRVAAIGATHIESQVSSLLDHAREVTNRHSGSVTDNDRSWQRALDALRGEHSGLAAAVVDSDSGGNVVASSPPSWAQAAAVASLSTTLAAHRSHVFSLAARPIVIGEFRLAHIALPLPPSPDAGTRESRIVSILIDLDIVRDRCVEPLRAHRSDIGLLTTERGDSLGVALDRTDSGMVSFWGGLAGLPPDVAAVLSARTLSLGGVVEVGDEALLMGDVSPVRIAGRTWRLTMFRPRAAVIREAKPLLLLCCVFALVALGGGGAAVVGLRRSREAVAEARRDANHWRSAAAEARREDRWRVIAEESREPIVFLEGSLVRGANRGAVEALDLDSHAGLLERDFLDFVGDEDRAALSRRLERSNRIDLEPTNVRARLVTARGRRRIVDLVLSTINTAEGRLARVSWQDLTSRERAEALLRTVVRSAPLSIILTDGDGKLIWANHVFVETSHYPAERFVGHELLPIVDARDRRRARVMMARAARGQQSESVLHIRRTDGELLAVAARAAPVHVGSELYGIIVIGFDAAAAPAFAGWERIPDGVLLAQLGTLLAHRLNNDLQGLVGVVEQLAPVEQRSDLAVEARRLVGNATRQLQQFSVLSRSSSASLQPVSLGALVETWKQRVENDVPSGLRLITRNTMVDDTIPADSGQITLLLDLAFASVAASLAGGGAFEVSIEPSPHEGAVRLAIFDTGSDAPEGTLASLSSLLVRPARDMVRAVARLVARHHGGVTGSKASVALGNRLWCDLLVTGEASPTKLGVRAPAAGAVLVADDEELVRTTLAEALRDLGHEVIEASNGAEVVDAVLAEPDRFALVVLDLVMPVMDGREALRLIRERLPGLPVLLSTGYDPVGDPVLANAEVLIKPFGIDEFVARVGDLIAKPGKPMGSGDRMHQ